jgi:hypothetical protein
MSCHVTNQSAPRSQTAVCGRAGDPIHPQESADSAQLRRLLPHCTSSPLTAPIHQKACHCALCHSMPSVPVGRETSRRPARVASCLDTRTAAPIQPHAVAVRQARRWCRLEAGGRASSTQPPHEQLDQQDHPGRDKHQPAPTQMGGLEANRTPVDQTNPSRAPFAARPSIVLWFDYV